MFRHIYIKSGFSRISIHDISYCIRPHVFFRLSISMRASNPRHRLDTPVRIFSHTHHSSFPCGTEMATFLLLSGITRLDERRRMASVATQSSLSFSRPPQHRTHSAHTLFTHTRTHTRALPLRGGSATLHGAVQGHCRRAKGFRCSSAPAPFCWALSTGLSQLVCV